MAASDFEYVLKYFFWIWVMLIGFGLFNGLIVLPAILGLIGTESPEDDSVTINKGGTSKTKSYPPASAFSGVETMGTPSCA